MQVSAFELDYVFLLLIMIICLLKRYFCEILGFELAHVVVARVQR